MGYVGTETVITEIKESDLRSNRIYVNLKALDELQIPRNTYIKIDGEKNSWILSDSDYRYCRSTTLEFIKRNKDYLLHSHRYIRIQLISTNPYTIRFHTYHALS